MRRAQITTTHDDPPAARRVAAALRPDNTPEVDTSVDGARVVTTIERETTGGLHATVDDYVVNCTVATRLTTGDGRSTPTGRDAQHANYDTAADTPADTRDTNHE
jgi:hypothetical protein